MTTAQNSPAGTSLVLSVGEVDAMRQAALHAFREALSWAIDQIPLDPTAELNIGELEHAIRSFDRAGALLDQLGWQPHGQGVEVDESGEYIAALAVLALAYDAHERQFLHHELADALDNMTAEWPTLNEDQAWRIVFEGAS